MADQFDGASVAHDDAWEETGFAQVPNNILRDRELSWKAKGLIAYLSSHRRDMRMTRSFLMGGASDGETSFRSGMKELREAGYVTVEYERNDPERPGAITHTRYVLRRYRRSEPKSGFPATQGSHSSRRSDPESGEPATRVLNPAGNDAQKKTQFKEHQEKENHACMHGDFWDEIHAFVPKPVDDGGRRTVRNQLTMAFQAGWTPARLAAWVGGQVTSARSLSNPAGFVIACLQKIPDPATVPPSAADVEARAIEGCTFCDENGRIGRQRCDHDPNGAARIFAERSARRGQNTPGVRPDSPRTERRAVR